MTMGANDINAKRERMKNWSQGKAYKDKPWPPFVCPDCGKKIPISDNMVHACFTVPLPAPTTGSERDGQ